MLVMVLDGTFLKTYFRGSVGNILQKNKKNFDGVLLKIFI